MRIAIILLTLFLSNEVMADIYKFTDTDGHVYYTNINVPRNGLYKRIMKTKIFHYPNNFTSHYTGKVRTYSGANKRKFTDLIEQAAYRYQVDAKLVHAVIQTESAYNSTAQSPAGAVGLMQLMPDTARRFGVTDRNDPDQNIEGGTRYLKHLITMFNPNLDLAVAAYNAGENAVIRYNNSIPPYPETQNYVKQVLALYKQ
jgi:soluble lytic murein transglycosylase-like protein